VPVECDQVRSRTLNGRLLVTVGPQQFWLGLHRVGQTVTLWMDTTTVHLSIDGSRIKTVSSRLSAVDLARLRNADARPAGAPPALRWPGRFATTTAVEVDRTARPTASSHSAGTAFRSAPHWPDSESGCAWTGHSCTSSAPTAGCGAACPARSAEPRQIRQATIVPKHAEAHELAQCNRPGVTMPVGSTVVVHDRVNHAGTCRRASATACSSVSPAPARRSASYVPPRCSRAPEIKCS
jgi:hypothetical protein